eukprot:CFRG3698T1
MENLERQLDELTAIQSCYEKEITVEVPADVVSSFANAVEKRSPLSENRTLLEFSLAMKTEDQTITYRLNFRFPIEYPSDVVPEVTLRCDSINRSTSDTMKKHVSDVLTESLGDESVMMAIETVRGDMEEVAIVNAMNAPTEDANKNATANTKAQYKRCTFLVDHMLNGRQHKNEKKIKDCASAMRLTGILFYGRPSIIIVEGPEADIEEYVREAGKIGKSLKKRKTQTLYEGDKDRKYEKIDIVEAQGKTESLDTTTLLSHLENLGIAGKYKHIIGVEELN